MYHKIEDAEALRFPDGMPVRSAADYDAWHKHAIASRGVAMRSESDETVIARVNHGRLIAICPSCECGMFVLRAEPMACCAECGNLYRSVEMPAELSTLAALLLARPKREHQNWQPTETIDDIRRENLEHGVMA
jgi:hypothetical protein